MAFLLGIVDRDSAFADPGCKTLFCYLSFAFDHSFSAFVSIFVGDRLKLLIFSCLGFLLTTLHWTLN